MPSSGNVSDGGPWSAARRRSAGAGRQQHAQPDHPPYLHRRVLAGDRVVIHRRFRPSVEWRHEQHPPGFLAGSRGRVSRALRPHPAVPHPAPGRARRDRHRRRWPAVRRPRPLACLRTELAGCPRQAARGHRHPDGTVRIAVPDRIQVAQALPQLAQQHALQQRRRRAGAHRHRPVGPRRRGRGRGIRPAAHGRSARGRIDRWSGRGDRPLRPPACRVPGRRS